MRIGWKAAVHDPAIASFRYRVLEPVAALAARGHAVSVYDPAEADRYDLVVFSKSYRATEQALARAVKARGGQVALDLCDNHFYNPYGLPRYRQARSDLLAMIALADRLIVSTTVLGGIVQEEAALESMPHVVGDVAERLALPPVTRTGKSLLWFGSHGSPNAPSGMNDLLRIADPLRAQHARMPFELVVASNDEAKFAALAPRLGVPARYVPWTAEGFPALLAGADGVVIPLSNNPFVAAKTHNRITAALWPGVPVVADAIDSYREFAPFAWLDDWATGLRTTLEEPAAARDRAAGARAYIDQHWTMERLAPQWEAALGLTTAAPVAADRPPADRPVPEAQTAGEVVDAPPRRAARASLYQGALDPVIEDRITGWARLISEPDRAVRVTLEEDGHVVASAAADIERGDLAAAGFRAAGCGFAIEVPSAWLDGMPRSFVIVADGVREIERQRAAFRPGDPLHRAPNPRGPAAPAAEVVAEPSPSRDDQAARLRDQAQVQALLADELEVLSDAIEQVRRSAARIVLAAGSARPPA